MNKFSQKRSSGPWITEVTHVCKYSQKMFNWSSDYIFVMVLFNSLSQRDCYCAFCLSGFMLFQMKYQDFSMKIVSGILILFVFLFCCQFLLQQGEEQGEYGEDDEWEDEEMLQTEVT